MFSSNTSQQSESYQIQRSLRFNSADSAYLNRTPASAGNRKTWTWSGWVKFCKSGWDPVFSIRVDGNNQFFFNHNESDQIRIYDLQSSVLSFDLVTTQVFRDYSAWYHLVFAVDTTQATASNRLKLYVNGNQVTAFNTASYPSQNTDLLINSTNNHLIGNFSTAYANAYMTEVNFIDGQALTPSSFGQTNANTGVWEPKPYAGTYGTNGFYLNFSDNSNTTATTLGKDYSGNGNNWTPNNFSVSAGAGNDSLVDVPTAWGTDTGVGGSVRGNYCTLNPLSTTSGTYTQGNLQYVGPNTGSYVRSNGTLAVSTGKWYWEVTLANAPYSPRDSTSAYNAFGFGVSTAFNSTTSLNSVTDAVILEDSGFYKNFSGSVTNGGTTFSSGDVLAVAVDLDANTFTFYRNNTQITTGTIGGTAGRELVPIIISYSNAYGVMDCNFGQRPFAYTAPSGFKALCTQNLPTPTIGATAATQAGKFFNPVIYTAPVNSSTLTVTGVGFQPDFTWWKTRSASDSNVLMNVLSGSNKYLLSNSTNAEATFSGIWTPTSDGFTASALSYSSNQTYVAWNWKANGAGVTNTAGSITSTVSANTTSGFSVVTFTGTGANATVGHGLGAAPKMILFKVRNQADNWFVYHVSMGTNKYMQLNTTASAITDAGIWQNTAPTSSVFSIGGSAFPNTWTEVAYCFAEVPGFSKFGSYTGNGSTDGPFVYCGFRPAYVMVKCSSPGGSDTTWVVKDKLRAAPYNPQDGNLYPNLANAEDTISTVYVDFLSNGFKIRGTYGGINGSSQTYIFAAFAEFPQKFSLAR